MKIFNFHLMPYRHADLDAIEKNGSAWVTYSNRDYDPNTGAISVAAVKDALKGTYQRALVWATDAKSGKRIEASWIFKLPAPVLLALSLKWWKPWVLKNELRGKTSVPFQRTDVRIRRGGDGSRIGIYTWK